MKAPIVGMNPARNTVIANIAAKSRPMAANMMKPVTALIALVTALTHMYCFTPCAMRRNVARARAVPISLAQRRGSFSAHARRSLSRNPRYSATSTTTTRPPPTCVAAWVSHGPIRTSSTAMRALTIRSAGRTASAHSTNRTTRQAAIASCPTIGQNCTVNGQCTADCNE